MAAELIIRVHADDRVEVKVKGVAEQDSGKPVEKKLCRRITKRLEDDLGIVKHREYEREPQQEVDLTQDDDLTLGGLQ